MSALTNMILNPYFLIFREPVKSDLFHLPVTHPIQTPIVEASMGMVPAVCLPLPRMYLTVYFEVQVLQLRVTQTLPPTRPP